MKILRWANEKPPENPKSNFSANSVLSTNISDDLFKSSTLIFKFSPPHFRKNKKEHYTFPNTLMSNSLVLSGKH